MRQTTALGYFWLQRWQQSVCKPVAPPFWCRTGTSHESGSRAIFQKNMNPLFSVTSSIHWWRILAQIAIITRPASKVLQLVVSVTIHDLLKMVIQSRVWKIYTTRCVSPATSRAVEMRLWTARIAILPSSSTSQALSHILLPEIDWLRHHQFQSCGMLSHGFLPYSMSGLYNFQGKDQYPLD